MERDMKKIIICFIAVIIIVTVSACGPTPEPTLSVEEIQGTAVALAMTSVAITQAALPTNTSLPTQVPTLAEPPTPFPTLPQAFPTSNVAVPTNTQVNPCNEPPPSEPTGTLVQVRFVNKSKGKVNLSFGMIQENDEGECGTYNFTIGPKTSPEKTVLAGCYWAWASISGTQQNSIAKSPQNICLTDTSQTRGVTITAETIGFD